MRAGEVQLCSHFRNTLEPPRPREAISVQGRWRVNSAEARAPHCPQRPSSVRRPGQGRRKRTCGLSADAAENKSPPHPSDQSLVWGGGNGPQPWWARQASRRGWGRLLEANRPSRKAGRRVPWVNWTLFLPRSSTLQNCPASPCSGASCGSQTLPPPQTTICLIAFLFLGDGIDPCLLYSVMNLDP